MVGRELRELGYDTQVENGKVRFQGGVRAIAETNLWLRAADRIKIVVGEFPARTFEELFQGVFALDWENYLPLGAKFPILKLNVLNQSSIMSRLFRRFLKKLLLKNYRSISTVRKECLFKKQEQNLRLKFLF